MPWRAAVRRADFAFVGDDRDELEDGEEESWEDWDSSDGRDRSVEDEEKVWLNQPDNRVGRSPMRDVDGDDAMYIPCCPCPMSEMGRSDLVRGRGKGFEGVGAGTGSMITGGSDSEADRIEYVESMLVSPACGVGITIGAGCSPPRSPPSRLPFFPFSLPAAASNDDDDELAMLPPLPLPCIFAAAGSVNDLDLSAFDFCFWRNLGSFEAAGPGVVVVPCCSGACCC